jgi:hypothetical protein
MNWRSSILLVVLLVPLLLVTYLATPGARHWVGEKAPDRLTTREQPTPTSAPEFRAERDLRALEIADVTAVCRTRNVNGTPVSWSDRLVLVDIPAGSAIDPATALGPRLDSTAASGMQFLTVTLKRPAWDLSPGDVVTLVAVPDASIGTPAALADRAPLPRVEGVTIISVPWTKDSEVGEEGPLLVALPERDDAFVDLVADSGITMPLAGLAPAQATLPSESTPAACDQ